MRIDVFRKATLRLIMPVVIIGLCLPVIAAMVGIIVVASIN